MSSLIHILDNQTDEIIGTISQKIPYWGDSRIGSIDNQNTFDFSINATHPNSSLLVSRNRLLIQAENETFKEYIIHNVVQNKRNEKVIGANASFVDLAKAKVIEPQVLQGATAATATSEALLGTEFQPGVIEYNGIQTINIEKHTNPLELLILISSTFDLEISYRIEVVGSKAVARYVDMKKHVPLFEGTEINFGKNLIGVKRNENGAPIVTALLGIGPKQDDGTFLTAFVEDSEALQRWGRKGQQHLIEYYEPQSTNDEMTLEQLTKLTQNELKKRIAAIVTYECEAVSLEHIFGRNHEKITEGMTVRIKDDGYQPPLYLEARIQKVDREHSTGKIKGIIIGNFIEYKKEDLEKQIASLKSIINDKISKLFMSTVSSSAGDTFKNSMGSTTLTARVFLGGQETDLGGTKYSYNWKKKDKDGVLVSTYSKTTKAITVNSSEITEKATFVVEISTDKVISTSEITITVVNDGQSLYTWVKYASDNNGTGISDDPTGRGYIGFAYNKTTPIESENPLDYTWNAVEGSQGVPGTSYYTWLKYADTPTSGMSDLPDGKKYMGLAHNKTSATESTKYEDYIWSLIKGDKGDPGPQGDQGIPGPPGDNGESLYTWIKYADDSLGSGMSDTPSNKKYIGLAYNKTSQTESNVAADYSWALIEGPQGVPGTTYYTWIKYADDANGTNMSDLPDGKKYMGIAYNKTTATESTKAADYSWSLIQGPQGVIGPPGKDGVQYYTWVKYADSPTTGMSDIPTGKKYIGLAVNKTSVTESSTYSDYTWSLIEGPQGVPGQPGSDGQTTYTWVKYADTPTSGMHDSPEGKRYLGLAYNKTTATESTNYEDYSWSPLFDNVEVGGTNLYPDSYLQRVLSSLGANGTFSRTPSSPTNLAKMTSSGASTYFALTNHSSDRTISFKQGKKYVLSFEIRGNITNLNYTYMMRNSTEGTNSGFNTQSITISETEWTKISMFKEAPWSTDTGYILLGSRDNALGKWFEVKNVKLEQGNIATDWTPNSSEPNTFTWIMFADDKDGANISSDPAGKFWRGVAYNKTTPTPSTSPTDYSWSFITDGWVKPGTVKIDGGSIYADFLSAITANLGKVTAGEMEGVTLRLGIDGNGDLQVWGDLDGDGTYEIIGRVDNTGAYYPLLFADDVRGNVINKYMGETKTVYFDTSTGDDANEGTTWAKAKKNIKQYIETLPKNLNGKTITLYFRGNITGGFLIEGFHNGNLQISGDTATTRYKVYGYANASFCTDGRFLFQGFDVIYDATSTPSGRLCSAYYCDLINYYSVKAYGNGGGAHGFWLTHSQALLGECHVYNISDRGLFAEELSKVQMVNCRGVAPVAIGVESGSHVTGNGTRWSGTFAVWNNSMIGAVKPSQTAWTTDLWVVDQAEGTPTQAAPPAKQTMVVSATTGDNYSSQGFWTNDEVKQGNYGYGARYGLWYFNLAAIKGKTVSSATLTFNRNTGVGASAARTANIRSHGITSRATRPASLSSANYSSSNAVNVSVAAGQTFTVDVTNLVNLNIAKGTHHSIGIYNTGSTDYMSLGITPTLHITYS